MSQPPSRPWFRLASIVRPPPPPTRPPAPAPVQPQPFRSQIPLSQAGQATARPPAPITPPVPPRASAPPSPIPPTTPAPVSAPVASQPARDTALPAPPPPQSTASPLPSKTPPATLTSPSNLSPKSPAKTGGVQPTPSIIRSPTTTPAQSPPPPISSKPISPVTKTSSSLPASPGQKASPQNAATRPDVSYSSLPSSPKTKPSAPPPSPLPMSPAFRTVPSSPAPPQPSPVHSAAPIPTVIARAASPKLSPKIDKPWVETPTQSTKEKLLAHPPSPLTLPPAQIKAGSDLEPIPAEIEQKTVLLQETEEKYKTTPKTSNGYKLRPLGETHSNNIAQQGKRELRKDKGVHTHKKHSDSEELGVRVVTLAGENKGAVMELSPSRKKNGSGAWRNGGQKLKSDSDEESCRMKDEKHKGVQTETTPMDAFINCNVQGVNNSILYNCSCSHNDPGVHLSVSRKSNGGHGVRH